ncbi:hypothetical protein [Labrenzia sp. DG1229]|uniref:hypothetical protein n=1 Tax=Labrenzia sp. DG1229 TaxID=681847 RepID=UPI0004900579|nr:hypothetical protein [Labrenzia sp. DG1229]
MAVASVLCSVGSGTAFELDSELDFALNGAGAFVTSVPRLTTNEDKVTLSYIGDLNCNTRNNLQNCQSYNLVCNFDVPDTIQLDFTGLGISYVPFTKMIKNSNRYPYFIYTDRIVRRYNRENKKDLDYDRTRAVANAGFQFTRAARLGEFDAGSYSIHWETVSAKTAAQLLEMLASGKLLLLAIPESNFSQTFYHRLPPSPEGTEDDLANRFAALCKLKWEEAG